MNDELEELLLVGGRKSEVGGHNALFFFFFFSRSSSSRAQNHVNSSPDWRGKFKRKTHTLTNQSAQKPLEAACFC
jgi:hypothetical protein